MLLYKRDHFNPFPVVSDETWDLYLTISGSRVLGYPPGFDFAAAAKRIAQLHERTGSPVVRDYCVSALLLMKELISPGFRQKE